MFTYYEFVKAYQRSDRNWPVEPKIVASARAEVRSEDLSQPIVAHTAARRKAGRRKWEAVIAMFESALANFGLGPAPGPVAITARVSDE